MQGYEADLFAETLVEYMGAAKEQYTLLNVCVQGLDGVFGIVSGLPTIEVQDYYLKNPILIDDLKKTMLGQFNTLELSVNKVYDMIRLNNKLLQDDESVSFAANEILLIKNIIPTVKNIYFGHQDEMRYNNIPVNDEISELMKELDDVKKNLSALYVLNAGCSSSNNN